MPIELHRRRIYIVPPGPGPGPPVLLMVMLVGSLNYSNNAALLLTCMLGAAGAASMLVAFRALDGLALAGVRAGQALAGQPLALPLEFESTRPRNAIRVDLGPHTQAFAIDGSGKADDMLPLATVKRDWQPLPRQRVWLS